MTLFSAVMILILLSAMVFYAASVGIFEQRISANDTNQKLAFHAAEAGIEHTIEYLFANKMLVSSAKEDVLSDGTDGWLFGTTTTTKRWWKCDGTDTNSPTFNMSTELWHPCRGETSATRRAESFFYYFVTGVEGDDPYTIGIDTSAFLTENQRVDVYLTLCVLTFDEASGAVTGCTSDTSVEGDLFMVNILARGQSDCDGDDCAGEALVVEPVTNFTALNGPPPSVPLTARSLFPETGSATVITNPNAGGIGVPISVWGADQGACGDPTLLEGGGNFTTCQPHEFYDTDVAPEYLALVEDSQTCSEGPLSYPDPSGGGTVYGYDFFMDIGFPCDLFEYYFGIPRSAYNIIKSSSTIIQPSGCIHLDENSSGLYWVTSTDEDGGGSLCRIDGSSCSFDANKDCVGTSENPVAIITAAGTTRIGGNSRVHGVVFVTDAEDAWPSDKTTPSIDILAGAVVVGAMVVDLPKVDGNVDNFKFGGNFKLIYGGSEIVRAHGSGNLGHLMGGWTDFPECWFADGDGCP